MMCNLVQPGQSEKGGFPFTDSECEACSAGQCYRVIFSMLPPIKVRWLLHLLLHTAPPNLLHQLTQHPPQHLTIYKRTPIQIKTIHLVQEIEKVQAASIFGVAADKTFARVSNPDTYISLHSNSKSFSFLKLFDLRPLSFAKTPIYVWDLLGGIGRNIVAGQKICSCNNGLI